MPVLAFPIGLAALVAWAVPLLIHLARRTETRPTDFPALRWLRQKPRPRHRPRFDERVLLIVRLVLIALVALWLARPVLPGSADRTAVTAYAPGVAAGSGAGRRVWLAPGFPPVTDARPRGGVPVDSLVRQLDAELPAGVKLTLVVPERLDGVDAERPRLSRAVAWQVVPGGVAAGARPRTAPDLIVRFAAERAAQVRYWRAVAVALGRRVVVGDVAAGLPTRAAHLVWLAGGPLPAPVRAWIAGGGTAVVPADAGVDARFIVIWRDAVGLPLAEAAAMGRGRVIRWTRELNPVAMPELLDADFPSRLSAVIAPSAAPARVLARDHAPLPGGLSPAEPVRDLRPMLALAIAALWLGERCLATARRRAAMP